MRVESNFTQTSNEPYNRHTYQLNMKNGSSIVFDDYTQLRDFWMSQRGVYCDCVHVLDAKNKKKAKGF